MDVGNIVIPSDIKEENFNICENIDDINNSLPTLIVGWNKTKELFKDKVSILHKQIEEDLYWTFSETERKVDYEIDILKFKDICYKNFGEDIIYLYVDIIHGKLSIIKKIINKIQSLKDPIFYITNKNMLYIFGDDIIFGIDLNITEYIGIKTQKIVNRLLNLPNSILIENEIFNKCKEFIKKLDNRYKLVPYIVKYGRYI
tara:strand:+ start:556 stop:1158 length:603 start_codon:yes stop_codon:yes gene_type:complete